MKKKFFFAALATIALASCTNDESVFEGIAQGDEINFAVAKYTPQTRAEHDSDVDFEGDVTVWSWYDGNSTAVIPGDVYNTELEGFYSYKYYWPVDDESLDFVAVPTSLVGTDYFTAPDRTSNGETTLTFKLDGTQDYHSTNLMTTQVLTGNRSTGTVALLFRHLLAKLNIKVTQKARTDVENHARWNVTVNSITLSGLHNKGNVTINDAWTAKNNGTDCLWESTALVDNHSTWNVKSAADWSLYNDTNPATTDLAANATANNYSSSETYYILPQELTAGGQKITINYTIVTDYLGNPTQPNTVESYTKTFDLQSVTAISKWAMNKVITYNIAIDPTEGLDPIEFTVKEEEWGTETGNAADLGIN